MSTTTVDRSDNQASRSADSVFQREDVDAALRATTFTEGLDLRGVAIATETADRLVKAFADTVFSRKSFRDETTIVVAPESLVEVATWMRDTAGFGLLSDLSPCDWLGANSHTTFAPKRFSVSYIITKLVPGAPRLRLQVWVDDTESIPSLISIYPTADWHEREAYDFFGIEFSNREGLRRLIMPEDWVGHPLRKDYPIGGEPVKFTNSLREI